MDQPRPLILFIFCLFKQTSLKFLQQKHVKNVHPLYSAGIRTHDLRKWVSSHNHMPLDNSCLWIYLLWYKLLISNDKLLRGMSTESKYVLSNLSCNVRRVRFGSKIIFHYTFGPFNCLMYLLEFCVSLLWRRSSQVIEVRRLLSAKSLVVL